MSSCLITSHWNVKTSGIFQHFTEHIKFILVFVYRQSMPIYWVALLYCLAVPGYHLL